MRHSRLTACYDWFHRRGHGAGSGGQVLHRSKSFRPGRGRDCWGSAPPALSGDCGTRGRTEAQLEAKRCRLCRHSIPIPRGLGVHQRLSSDHHKCTLTPLRYSPAWGVVLVGNWATESPHAIWYGEGPVLHGWDPSQLAISHNAFVCTCRDSKSAPRTSPAAQTPSRRTSVVT